MTNRADIQTDILVIGAGASGLAAALAAHEAGASTMIVEKGERLGGTAAISGGIVWMPNNRQMAAAGVDDSADDARAYFAALDNGDIDFATLEAFLKEGAGALAFLEDIGAAQLSLLNGYPDYYLDRPGAKPTGGRALDCDLFAFTALGEWADKVYTADVVPRLMLRETPLGGASGVIPEDELQARIKDDARAWGQALIGRLLKACLERGMAPQLNAPVARLLKDGRGVVGAELESGETIRAGGGVVLATGGFEWDADLRQTFLRGPMNAPASPPMSAGDGLKMAMAVGAGLGNMTSAWWMPTLKVPGDQWAENGSVAADARALPVLIERTLPHSIIVNAKGVRFCNEAHNYSALAGAFQAFDPQTYGYPNLPAYLVFDSQYRERYPMATVMPGAETPNWMTSAQTLSELADRLGVDGAALSETVARFNAGVAAGEDPEFARGASDYDRFYGDRSRPGRAATLGDLTKPPFYAVEIHMGALGTNGGPKTDETARVLDVDGAPIDGLYAAGNVMSGPTGGVYAGAGGTLGPALTFGVIAGRAAAARARQSV